MSKFQNNYIIGLGGTGGEAVAAFRRATVLRHNEYERLIKKADGTEGARFQYLYIDSNVEDIAKAGNSESEKWQVPGGKITLTGNEKLCIDGSNFSKESALLKSNIKPWFGSMEGVDNDVFGGGKIVGADQRRRYGRMLFARAAENVRLKLLNGINALRKNSSDPNAITFHIFATLGGGTGSGSIVDMVTLVHELMPGGAKAEVLLYLFIGGDDQNVRLANVGFLYHNEYAALRDLNALMCNRYKPVIAGDPNNNTGRTFAGNDPIGAVYICSETSKLALDLEHQVEYTANACFDIISLMRSGIYGPVEKAFTGEDIQLNNPGESCNPADPDSAVQVPPTDGSPERSYRFQTVGVSRCKEPVMEIRTILKSVFAAQVNDRWLRGSYKDRKNRILSADSKENADIYDGQAIIPGSRLETRCNEYKQEKLKAFHAKFNPDEIEFTSSTLADVNKYVRDMVEVIEKDTRRDLAEYHGEPPEWQQLCTTEADNVLKTIKAKLEVRRKWSGSHSANTAIWGVEDITKYLQNLKDRLEKADTNVEFTKTLGNMEKRTGEWSKICGLTELLFDKNTDMFTLHLTEAEAVIRRALSERRKALRAEVEKKMVESVHSLNQQMGKVAKELTTAIDDYNKKADEQLDKIKDTMADVQLVYNEKRVAKHSEYLRSAEAEPKIARSLAQFEQHRAPGTALESGYPMPDLDDLDKPHSNYWNESMRIHDELVQSQPIDYQAAFHASIFEALADLRNNSPAEYNQKLGALCHNVNPLASIEPVPSGGSGLQTLDFSAPVRAVEVGLPDIKGGTPQQEETKQAVIAYIEGETRSLASAPNKFKRYSHLDKHEVRILYCEYWMPVRFFKVCNHLQKEMVRLYASQGNTKITTLYYSHIDDLDEQKPDLIPTNINPQQREIATYFKMSCHMHLPGLLSAGNPITIAAEKNQSDPEPRLRLIRKDAFFVDRVYITDNYDSAQLRDSSPEFGEKVRQNFEMWMRTYAVTEGAKVLERYQSLIQPLQAADSEKNKAAIEELYALKKRFEKELKKY